MSFSSSEVVVLTYKDPGDLYPLKYLCFLYLAISPLKCLQQILGKKHILLQK